MEGYYIIQSGFKAYAVDNYIAVPNDVKDIFFLLKFIGFYNEWLIFVAFFLRIYNCVF
jgi:hypothetical protein